MKYRTVVEREGEYLGPVDWDFDFASIGSGMQDKYYQEKIAQLRRLENGKSYEATTDTGSPRVGWGKVLEVGMYDGWPFWRPVPSVLIDGWNGASWHWFGSVTEIREMNVQAEARARSGDTEEV